MTVTSDAFVRSHLGFRGSVPRRPGESHPRLSDVLAYNDTFTDALRLGFSLGEALDYAESEVRRLQAPDHPSTSEETPVKKRPAKKKRPVNPWTRPEVIDYVLDSYGGTEEAANGRMRRMFLWADEDGEVWIGNSAAFAEHCSELFHFPLLPYDYVSINRILIDVGERIREKSSREPGDGKAQLPLAADKRRARSPRR